MVPVASQLYIRQLLPSLASVLPPLPVRNTPAQRPAAPRHALQAAGCWLAGVRFRLPLYKRDLGRSFLLATRALQVSKASQMRTGHKTTNLLVCGAACAQGWLRHGSGAPPGRVAAPPCPAAATGAVAAGVAARVAAVAALSRRCAYQPRGLPLLQLSHADLFAPGTSVSITSRLGSCARRCAEGGPPPAWVERARLPWPPVVETNLYDVSWKYNMRWGRGVERGGAATARSCVCFGQGRRMCHAVRHVQAAKGGWRDGPATQPQPPSPLPGCSMSDLMLLNPGAGLLLPGAPLVPACYGPEAPHFPYLGSDVAFGQVRAACGRTGTARRSVHSV